ncbi:MAG: HEPN domain-containing protein [Chlamydiae bacterium]|nr:HEPN domain-containing protein [Chlamydiota bacterium]MBI3266927.1 HEPN domain-containing protein [Chlamydiota bacterium]
MSVNNPWFNFADEDYHMAQSALEDEIYNQTCFHAQQGVEKLLKGFLFIRNRPIHKTHSLLELFTFSHSLEPRLSEFKDFFRELDKFYIPTRYPDALPGSLPDGLPHKKDAANAFKMFSEIRDFILNLKIK